MARTPSITVGQVLDLIWEHAPNSLAESWDNCGLLIGSKSNLVTSIVLAVDVNQDIIDHAANVGANLIITHHPLIFKPVSKLTADGTPVESFVYQIASKGMSLICMHTNVDSCIGGLNDRMVDLMGIAKNSTTTPILPNDGLPDQGLGRYIKLQNPISLKEAVDCVSAIYKDVRVVDRVSYPIQSSQKKDINTIAVCSGCGSSLIDDVKFNCDLYITGDIGYHQAQHAQNNGLRMIVLDHLESEYDFVYVVKNWIEKKFPDKIDFHYLANTSEHQTFVPPLMSLENYKEYSKE